MFRLGNLSGKPAQGNDAKCGFACHTIVRTRDYVLTGYGHRWQGPSSIPNIYDDCMLWEPTMTALTEEEVRQFFAKKEWKTLQSIKA